jgi:tetratricopeptide (TPR) repeat protein
MIAAFLLLAAAGPAEAVPADMKACLAMVRDDVAHGAKAAAAWRARGGGIDAARCQALALIAEEKWSDAALTFEQAAADAERLKDPRRADLWVQAGNAWLAGGEAAKARTALDKALALEGSTPQLKGEAWLDRARASVALNDLVAARSDIDRALQVVAADPFAWYLSAALARRAKDMTRARADIARAVGLAPTEASILLEAGNIAGVAGDVDGARLFYERAAKAAPNSEAGRAAEAALAANGGPVTPPR